MQSVRSTSRTVGGRIQRARWDAGLSQEKLAEKASLIRGRRITRFDVMRWEAGRNEPRLDSLRAIADVTGKPLDYFADEGDESG